MKKMLVLLLFNYSINLAQDDFVRGAFLFWNTSVDYSRLKDSLSINYVQAVVERDDGTKLPEVLQNTGNLNIMGLALKEIYPKSSAQRMVFEAELATPPNNDWNYFSFRNGIQIDTLLKDSVGLHSPGYMVKEPWPGNEYNYGETTFVASIYLKRGTVPDGEVINPLVARFEVYAKDPATTPPTYFFIKSQDFYYNDFASTNIEIKNVGFERLFRPGIPRKPLGMLTGSVSSLYQLADHIDIRLYWYGNVTTWLDKIIVQDSTGLKLFAGGDDAEIIASANQFKNSYPLMKRFYTIDEPYMSAFLAYNYVQNLTRSAYGTPSDGKGDAITALNNYFQLNRFFIDAQPRELFIDPYSINANIPTPAFPNSHADSVGIAQYTTNDDYTTALQSAIQNGFIYACASAATLTKAAGKSYFVVPQLHGDYFENNGMYRKPTGEIRWRPPTGNEVKLQCNLSIAYGAKGIVPFPLGTERVLWTEPGSFSSYADFAGVLTSETGGDGIYRNHWTNYGLFYYKTSQNPTQQKVLWVGYKEKWDALADVFKRYKMMSTTLSSLGWQGTKSWHNGATVSNWAQGIYITSLSTGDAGNATYVESGRFTNGSDNYIFVVNRRTLNTDSRNITMTINNSGYSWITDVYSNKKYIVASNGTFTDTFAPGEGKLYKISPMTYTWSGDITVMNTVTVPYGTTLTVNSGSILRFAPSQGLTMNGVLAVGSSVTFTSLNGSTCGSWGSIVLNGGAAGSYINSSTIEYGTEINLNSASYVNIHTCTITNTINGINAYNSQGYVSYNTFSNQRDHGIIMNNSSLYCYNNSFAKSDHSGAALLFTAGAVSDYNCQNSISGYNWGITSSWGSNISLGYEPMINNLVTDCLYGIHAYQSSVLEMSGWEYGYNSVYDNNDYNAIVYSNSDIYAAMNYWGWPVNTALFYCESGSTLDYSNPLETDPQEENMIASDPKRSLNRAAMTVKEAAQTYSLQTIESNPVKQARKLRKEGKEQEAFDIVKSLFEKNESRTAALLELYALYKEPFANEIETMLSSLPVTTAPLGRYLYGQILSRKGELNAALETLKELSGSPFAKAGVLAQFYIQLYANKNLSKAEELPNGLNAESTNEEFEISLARQSLDNYRQQYGLQVKSAPKKSGEEIVAAIPASFSLSQNYPNPFNPTTLITFALPEPSNVILTVHDYLGREVTTVVNRYMTAGTHSLTFDAKGLSSGVYFYRISAGGNSAIKKMVVMK